MTADFAPPRFESSDVAGGCSVLLRRSNTVSALSLIQMTDDFNDHHHDEYSNEQNGQQHKAC